MADFRTGTPAGAPALGFTDVVVPNTPTNKGYKTYPVRYNKLALYTLQIRNPTGSNSVQDSYTFPLSPESVRKEYVSLTNFYDVQGNAGQLGVQRVVDVYGTTPPTFVIEGTTGWKLHQTDNYAFTGLQSVRRVEQLLANFAQYNQIQIDAGNNNLYQLWFYDYFRDEYWSVFPVGPQGIRQSQNRPLYVNYAFRLVAVQSLTNPTQIVSDFLQGLFNISGSQAATAFTNGVSQLMSLYTSLTPKAS